MGDVFEEYSEKGHKELPALTIIQGGGTLKREDSDRNLMYDESNLANYKMVHKDDFIVHLRSFEGGLEKSSLDGIISPAYHTFHSEEVDSRFYYSYFRSYEFIKHKLVPHVYGIRDGRSIDIEGMKSIEIPYTLRAEQKKIGDCLEVLDHLITLHQRKRLGWLKVGKNDWEQRKVSEMFKVTRGYVLPATDASEEISDEMPYPVYSSQTKDNGLMGYYSDYLYEDAITWTTDGANAGTVNFRYGRFYCTNVCGVLLSNKVEASKAVAEALNNVAKRYVSYVGNPKLMNNVMADIQIKIPTSREERAKISSYFFTLDHLITLHQRKCDESKKIKKFMLQKMFPQNGSLVPEIRFDGFTDDWEQRKLSELTTMHARIGWQNLRTSEFLDNGEYMLITGTDFNDGAIDYSTCHYVEKERYDQDKNIQIHNGNILITKDGTLGKVAYVQGLTMPATLNAGVFNVEIKDENLADEKYLFQYLKAPFLMDYVSKKATGGTIKHLNQSILVDFPVAMPKKEEQAMIGDYFESLDHLITLHQQKCDDLKKLKKYMLQNMFVLH